MCMQIAVDKAVLSRIALTMAEIRAIRLEHLHTLAVRPNKSFQLSQSEEDGEQISMDLNNSTPCLFNNEREP